MSRFYGKIGFAIEKENIERPGIWESTIIEKNCVGDLSRNSRSLQSQDKANDDINISNEISIIADPYTYQNFHSIRYITFMGTKWKVNNVEVKYPRLILSTGGIYNG